MLSDLGIHGLARIIGAPKSAQDNQESDLAYAMLSACIAYEGVWTLYLGRPSSIPTSVMNIAASRCNAKRKADPPWLNAWVGLCVPMAEISHILNEQPASIVDISTALQDMLGRVEKWYDDLPSDLRYDENSITNMELPGYGLHAQYCKVQILLRQALAKHSQLRKNSASNAATQGHPQNSPDHSEELIYQYSLRIARLVVTYREAFGTEKIPSIMLDNAVVAATAMIKYLRRSSSSPETDRQQMWLRELLKSLESLQPHFPIIGRMLDSLKQISGENAESLGRDPPEGQNPSDDTEIGSQSLDLTQFSSFLFSTSSNFHDDNSMMWDGLAADIFPSSMATTNFHSGMGSR